MNRKFESRILFVAGLSCFCLFACFAFSPAQANPLKGPRRAINQYIVDLNPLFHWWTNRAGERPLDAWVHITGRNVGTNSWGWVLHAHIEEDHGEEHQQDERATPQAASS